MERERLFEIAKLASAFFFKALGAPNVGSRFREYLEVRGLTVAMAKEYRLGAAPDSQDALIKTLGKKGVKKDELVVSGLATLHKEEFCDKFWDRLMFTIQDIEGCPIAFAGRVMDADRNPKYLNSPASSIFDKGNILYNAHRAVKMSKKRGVVLVEGYMDVLAMENVRIPISVASMGTSLTAAQAKIIRRLFGGAYVMYDGDEAGQKATEKAVIALGSAGAWAKVASLPEGKDPDDVIKEEGREAMLARLQDSQDAFQFLINRVIERNKPPLNGHSQDAVVRELMPMIVGCKDLGERDERIKILSESIEAPEKIVRKTLERVKWNRR